MANDSKAAGETAQDLILDLASKRCTAVHQWANRCCCARTSCKLGGCHWAGPDLSISSAVTPRLKSDSRRVTCAARRNCARRQSGKLMLAPSLTSRSVSFCDSGDPLHTPFLCSASRGAHNHSLHNKPDDRMQPEHSVKEHAAMSQQKLA